uniref:Uncharacterized protein n=1 Tax=Aegilops tauschii subsp. strangulata TaxID=200361 RepID=A0A453H4Y7_AEGTS
MVSTLSPHGPADYFSPKQRLEVDTMLVSPMILA